MTRQDIINEMNANAVAWWSADDATKKQLHDRNVQLAAMLGATKENYNASTGTWNIPDVTPGSPIVTTQPFPHPPAPVSTNVGAAMKDAPSGTGSGTASQNNQVMNADGTINLNGAINAGIIVLILLMFIRR